MDRDEYERMVAATDDHWWYLSSRSLLAGLVRPFLDPLDGPTRFLDAAGGSGATGRWLAEAAPTVLTDLETGIMRAAAERTPGYLPVLADLNAMPHPSDAFDLSLCVTALCHRLVPDPLHVVRELARVTKPGGLVVLMEPGVRRLRRGHDQVTHTARRFSRTDLRELVEGAHLEVVRATGAYTFLVPPAVAIAVIERGRPASDLGRSTSGLDGLLSLVARLERGVVRWVDLPFGLSVIAIGRKPAG